MSPGERLRTFWANAEPMHARPGATEAALAAFESRHQIVLPAEFRAYLALVDGNLDCWRGTKVSFWPLERIESDLDDWQCFTPGQTDTLLPFADFLLDSHAFAIRLSTDPVAPVFLVFGGEHAPQLCAKSFAEFVDLYLRDDVGLYG